MKKLLLVLAFSLACTGTALAQGQVTPPSNVVAVTSTPATCAPSYIYVDITNKAMWYGASDQSCNSVTGTASALKFGTTTQSLTTPAATGAGQCVVSSGSGPYTWNAGSCAGTAATAWSALTAALGSVTINNTTYATTFQQQGAINWTWANTTNATSGTNQSSPIYNLSGTVWHGGASTTDNWTVQNVITNGTDGATTLKFTHTAGSTGTATVSVPILTFNAAGGTVSGTEGTCSGAAASADVLCLGDSTSHTAQLSLNNGSFYSIPQWNSTTQTAAGLLYAGTSFPLQASSADFTVSSHTISSGASGVLDLSSATGTAAFKVPAKAGDTASASAAITFDSTNKNYHGYVNGADSIFANFASAPTTGDVITATVSSGNTLLSDSGVLGTNLATASSNFTASAMVYAGGANKTLTSWADFTVSSHTGSLGASGILDLSGATGSTAAFKVPVNAGNTASAAGVLDYDSTNSNYHGYNGADSIFGIFPTASAPTSGDVIDASVSSSKVLLHDSGVVSANLVTTTSTLTANQVALGAGSKTVGILAAGSQYNVLTMGASNPGWGQVSLAQSAAVTGLLGYANGGTNAATAAAAFINLAPAATTVGSLIYCSHVTAGACDTWNFLSGNSSGTNYLSENSSGSPSWASGTASIAWNAIGNPGGTLTLSMGGNTSEFDYSSALAAAWSWLNTTAATSGTAQSSPVLKLGGRYWSGSDAADYWTVQDSLGNGTNGTSTLTFAHTGTSGATAVLIPTLNLTNVLGAAYGGTGSASPTAHGFLIAEGSSGANSAVCGANQLPVGVASSDPTCEAVPNAALANSTIGIAGTTNQITSSSATPALGGSTTLAIANPFTFPGKATLAASTTSAASLNVPSGSAPTTGLATSDLWNLSGILQFYDGTHTNSITTVQSAPTTLDVAEFSGTSGLLADAGFLASNVVRKDASNAGAAGMTLDMHASTTADSFRAPVQAGATSGQDGSIVYDSTGKITHLRTNGADSTAISETSTSTTTSQVLHATVVAGIGSFSAIAAGDLPGGAGEILAGSGPALTYTPTLGVQNTTQGTVTLAGTGAAGGALILNGTGASPYIFTVGASPSLSASNTLLGPTAVPTTGHLLDCSTTSTTCTLHDSGVVTANVVMASSPGAGVAHFAGSTQTVTSSAVTPSDATGNTSGSGNFVLASGASLSSPALTTPSVTTIYDGNGKPFISSSATTSAVDSVTLTNAATASPATVAVSATGSDSNINLNLVSKGTGVVEINGSAAGTGTVTTTGSPTTNAVVTMAGSTVIQTPSSSFTYSSGTLNFPAGGVVQSSDTGTPSITFGANSITFSQPVTVSGTTHGILLPCGNPVSPASGDVGITPPSSCSSYGNYNLPALPSSAGLFHVSAVSSNVSSVSVSAVVDGDLSGQVGLSHGGTATDLSASGGATYFLAENASHVVSARAIANTDLPGAAGEILAGSTPALTYTPSLGVDNSNAGTLQLANASSAAHTILASAATTSNTVNFFATAPTTGDLVSCVTSSTTCTLTDSSVLAANVVTASGTMTQYGVAVGTGTKTVAAITAGVAGQLLAGAASANPAFTYTPTLGSSGNVGTLTLYPASGSYTVTLGTAASPTASSTVDFFAAVPTTGDLLSCTTASTTCTLTDAGVLAANVMTSTSTLTSGDLLYGGGSKTASPSSDWTISSSTLTAATAGAGLDLSTATGTASFKLGHATTASADGAVTFDATSGYKNYHVYSASADAMLAPIASKPTTGHLLDTLVASNNVQSHDSGIATSTVVTSAASLTQYALMVGTGSQGSATLTAVGGTGTLLQGSTGANPAFTATPTLGVAGTTAGTLAFCPATGSNCVTIGATNSTNAWTLKFPTTAGTSGYALTTDGSGNTTWTQMTGSGTVNSGTAGQMAYYATSTNAVSGNANATISSGALTLGQSGTAGSLVLYPSSGSYTMTLGTAGSPTAASTVLFPAAVPTANHMLYCAVSSTTCTLTDSGFSYATVVTSASSLTQYGVVVGSGSQGEQTITVGGAGTVLAGAASANPSFTATPTHGVQNTTQGTLTLAGSSSAAGQLVLANSGSSGYSTTLASAATANNTILFPASVPTANDLLYCAVSSTTCTLTDAGFTYSTVVRSAASLTQYAVMVGTGTQGSATLSAVGAAGQVLAGAASANPSFTYTPTLGSSGNAGTLTLYPSSGSYTVTLAAAGSPSASSTVDFFASAPTTGDLIYCSTSSTTCTLTDAGFAYSNVVRKDAANTAGSSMTLDMSSATGTNALKVPVVSSGVTSAAGAVVFDSATGYNNYHLYAGGADSIIMPIGAVPTTGHLMDSVVATNNAKLHDSGIATSTVVTSASSVTQYATVVGAGSQGIAVVGPDSHTTYPLFSGGASANPGYRAIAAGDLPANTKISSFGATFDGGGSALSAATSYTTAPFACTISATNILLDTGSATLTVWRVATGGSSLPTVSNTISTSGVSCSNQVCHSTNVSDFTSTAIAANDVIGVHIVPASSATWSQYLVECDR